MTRRASGSASDTTFSTWRRTASAQVFDAPTLNPFLALGRTSWEDTIARIDELVRAGADLVPLEDADVGFPFTVERLRRLLLVTRARDESRTSLPAGRGAAASELAPPAGRVPRPRRDGRRERDADRAPVRPGEAPTEDVPRFGPSRRLDIELEIGFVVGVGSRLGEPVRTAAFRDHVFGVVLVNDWSARDIQAWEYQPLGPFLGKSFATSVGAWVTPLALLEDRFVPAPQQDPEPLPYLRTEGDWALDIELEVELGGTVVSRTNARGLYWTMPQQLAHATVNGASIATGDLFASGTISGPEHGSEGSLIELTRNGEHPIGLANGSTRAFLEDDDEVVLRGRAGELELAEVRGVVVPARC